MPDELASLLLFLAGAATTLGVEWLRAAASSRDREAQTRAAREGRQRDVQLAELTAVQEAAAEWSDAARAVVSHLMTYKSDDGELLPPDPEDVELDRVTRRMIDCDGRVRLHVSRVTDDDVRHSARAIAMCTGYIFGDGLDDLVDTRDLVGNVSRKLVDLVGARLRSLYAEDA